MFRAQANPMDAAVNKATDENLTVENWEFILDVCDQASASPSAPAQAIGAVIKRLAHRNANVQLYTLELANALSQNCGVELHRELASKAFTEALLRLAADRNTHAQVKQKVFERMEGWSEQFRGQPELGIMDAAYQKLKIQQPGLMPPSKPTKREISSEDRKKEEEELQMALALSIKDSKGAGAGDEHRGGSAAQAQSPQATQASQGTTAATVSRVRALYDFMPSEPGELAFQKNDIIAVLESVYKDWWKGSLRGQTGIFPLNYVEKLQDPTKEELERDAQMESEVFAEIKNVEKLLALLSVGGDGGARRGERDEDEISELYQRTLSIRPKLIELIARYSQKKDDFTQLNEKFIKARRDYEALLESSMAQPQYQQQYPVRPRPNQTMYPPQQQMHQPPPQGYNHHMSPVQAYPPQQAYPQQSQQHPPPPQDPQRFYSPAPVDQGPPQHQNFQSPYSPQSAGPVVSNGPAPFHFIPGGLQPAPLAATSADARRRTSPPPNVNMTPSDPYAPTPFNDQMRPNSIHTLNSGNPQELATSGYESPIDNRRSYPSAQQIMIPAPLQPRTQQSPPPPQTYDPYPPQAPPPQASTPAPLQPQHTAPAPLQPQHTAPLPPRTDRDGLPSRQRTESLDTPTSIYSPHPSDPNHHPSQIPAQPSAPPPSIPSSIPPTAPDSAPQPQGQIYQAYQPYSTIPPQPQQQVPFPPAQQQHGVPSEGGAGGDPGDFYR